MAGSQDYKRAMNDFKTSDRAASLTMLRLWLMTVAVLIVAMVLVGGATRLTESGLSIVEWKPVAGALPPLSEQQWTRAFDAYKTIPQYRELNAGMSLSEFKTIFWWEWSHRLLGRVIGVVYLLPFLWFLWRGRLAADLKRRLWIIFALGGLQGAVGWWMVASGLTQRVEVSQYRLAAHLILALVIFAAIVWTLRRLAKPARTSVAPRLRAGAGLLLALTFVQIYFGALVAGLRAGRAYNTWPDIDGALIPSASRLFFEEPWWRNLFDNVLTVQFEHRMTAYALLAVALLHLADAVISRSRAALGGALTLAVVILMQAALGVGVLLHQVPVVPALAHQALAIAVLASALIHLERLTPWRNPMVSRAGVLAAQPAE